MNAFSAVLEKHEIEQDVLRRGKLTTLQVNMGDLCNQSCLHCHISASPQGQKIMSKQVVDDVLAFLKRHRMKTLDITGGAPELNPHFEYLVKTARPLVDQLIVRSNLTVLFEKGKEHLPELFKTNKVHLICSLPCYTQDNVDRQRGAGVFDKSIRALKQLNESGFARQNDLQLDLVYNALGAYLPGTQSALERDYKKALSENHGIEFNNLLTITNVPIKNFKHFLESNNEYDHYSRTLEDSFNPETLETLMCRSFLSVGYEGKLYDCDFNLALGLALKNESGENLTIGNITMADLERRKIMTDEHCLACTAGSGSSCQGALTNEDICCSKDVEKETKETVKEYYGKVLQSKQDLKTSACCSAEAFPEPLREIVKNIEPEILDKFYGCGSPIPPLVEGCRILDLGSGTGRDVYIAAALAGEKGFVTGVDMTDEQLAVARKHKETQMKRFGFKQCNVDFKNGYIEDLKEAGIEDNSQDVVISNCVINLSPEKKKVFAEIFRILKPGGEFYFSDVFADRRVPEGVKNDPVLYGECLGGALYVEDFRRYMRDAGCLDIRYVSIRQISIDDPKIAERVGDINFFSVMVRAFKLDCLEDGYEDYGQTARYLGTIPGYSEQFQLDDDRVFPAQVVIPVCGNTAAMLSETRYGKHFEVTGDRSRHLGVFYFSDGGAEGGCCSGGQGSSDSCGC